MENLQEQISKLSQSLHQLALQRGIVLEDGPGCYDPYSQVHPYVAPTCHVCGCQGHVPADCQQGYSPTQDCFGMNFAQQHSSYHNNYSAGWSGHPNMPYRHNIPMISSFSPSYQMQEFRCAEENQVYPHQYHSAPTYAPDRNQQHTQLSAHPTSLEEHSSWMAEIKKQ
jgi:hypothetical protein